MSLPSPVRGTVLSGQLAWWDREVEQLPLEVSATKESVMHRTAVPEGHRPEMAEGVLDAIQLSRHRVKTPRASMAQ